MIEVAYPAERGAIGLRGSRAPLSWEHTQLPTRVEGDKHIFEFDVPEDQTIDVKLVRNDEDWAGGRNYVVHAGEHLRLEPAFERTTYELTRAETIGELRFQVLLPPSYGEQTNRRYPVLYAQDGQALWAGSPDPFGVWKLEETLNSLFDLSACEELIVVAIDTADNRLDRLGPWADPEHGGGQGAHHLGQIVETLKPHVDMAYRTRPGREDTGAMGSSMGGLFSFYAAWTRPDVFGKAICLSPSFWWANRAMIRAVAAAPPRRPIIYLDSGAALNPDEARANDNFYDTRAMHRALTRIGYTAADLHRLTFPGERHQAAAWAARVTLPLQLLFPQPTG